MGNRQWIRRVGPFEVAEKAVGELADQVEFWKAAAQEEKDEKNELVQRLEESDELIEKLQLALDDG